MGDDETNSSFIDQTFDQPVTMGQLLQLLQQLNSNNSPRDPLHPTALAIDEKLNNQNYTQWSKLMHLAISGRGMVNHIIDFPPSKTDLEYSRWIQRDSTVILWIIENIEPDLVNQYLDYPTARDLWEAIKAMYSSYSDNLQLFDLTVKANSIKQGTDSIKTFYNNLVTIWKEIDQRVPNPMKDPEDINIYNGIIQRDRLYQFLAGINESLDKDRRDLLNQEPLPTVDEAYATIRRKIAKRNNLNQEAQVSGDKPEARSCGIGSRLISRSRPGRTSFRREDDKTNLKCTHCGGTRHTREGCFSLVGYPDWWPDNKKNVKANLVESTIHGTRAREDGEGRTKNGGTAAIAHGRGNQEFLKPNLTPL